MKRNRWIRLRALSNVFLRLGGYDHFMITVKGLSKSNYELQLESHSVDRSQNALYKLYKDWPGKEVRNPLPFGHYVFSELLNYVVMRYCYVYMHIIILVVKSRTWAFFDKENVCFFFLQTTERAYITYFSICIISVIPLVHLIFYVSNTLWCRPSER